LFLKNKSKREKLRMFPPSDLQLPENPNKRRRWVKRQGVGPISKTKQKKKKME
jgi:hypothetical protein